MIITLVALFGAGLASFLAPCVLPVVPGILGALAPGRAAGSTLVAPAALFVAGFAAVFVALGAGAGAIGDIAGSSATARIGGVLAALFGVALLVGRPFGFGSWRPTLPAAVGRARPVLLGLVFGTAWTPCVGPLVGAALVAAGGTGSPWRGAAGLAAYAAGLGAPLVAVAAGLSWSSSVQRGLRRAGPALARVAGVVLVVTGVAMVVGRYTDLVAALRS